MKTKSLIFSVVTASILASNISFADQNTPKVRGELTCTVGDDLTLDFSKDRKKFDLIEGDGNKISYVVKRSGTGDDFIFYSAISSNGSSVILSFTGDNDTIRFVNGSTLEVTNCKKK